MAEPFLPSSYTTIGALIDGDYQLAAYCDDQDCRHWTWLDLEALAEKLGRDQSTLHWDLTPKLRCSKCGGKKITLSLSPPTQPSR